MTTYKELQVQIEKLQQQAEEMRQKEIASAITAIKSQMQEYGITPADLGLARNKKNVKARPAVEPKYRNTATDQTWAGRGKPPKWIAGKDRDQFLIK